MSDLLYAGGVIERMVVYMSDRCNGATTTDRVGFNKLDTHMGHSLAEQVRQGKPFTFAQRAAAHKMLRKYAKQLGIGGFDIASVPVPDATAPGVEAKVGGVCFVCSQQWEPGSLIRFAPDKRRYHADCEPVDVAPAQTRSEQEREQAQVQDIGDVRVPEQDEHMAAIRDYDGYISQNKPELLTGRDMLMAGPKLPSAEDALELARGYGWDHENLPSTVETKTRTGKTVRELLGPSGPIAASLPGYEERHEQIDCAEGIERALRAKRHIVVEAGTGTGKTFMYLAAALNSGKKTIVSTATKALQGQVWKGDIPFLQEHLLPFSAAILKGRANYECVQRRDDLIKEIDGGLFGVQTDGWKDQDSIAAYPQFVEWSRATQDGDIDTLSGITHELREKVTTGSDGCYGKRCPKFSECWVEKAKQRAEAADVVVVNHSLLMRDRKIQMETHGRAYLLPAAQVIILDEAHHLEDQATDAFADELTAYSWRMCQGRIEDLTTKHKGITDEQREQAENYMTLAGAATEYVREACEAIEQAFDVPHGERKPSHIMVGGFHDRGDTIGQAIGMLYEYMRDNTPRWLTDEKEREFWKKSVDLVGGYARKWQSALHAPDESDGRVRYAELSRFRKTIINVKPIEVADILRAALFDPMMAGAATADDIDSDWDDEPRDIERATVVCTSATIAVGSGMATWRARVGLDDAVEMIVDSPFDYRHNAVLYIPDPKRGFQPVYTGPKAEQYQRQIADEMLKLVMASKGGAFLLFTSRRMMDYVYSDISYELQDIRLTPMKQGENGISRPALIEQFKQTDGAVLFGVASFWEGVDVQGDALRLVAIDKMPFPQPDDPIQKERERLIKERGGEPFTALSVPFATIKLKQGFGRLIRTKTDRGAVAILDARLRVKGYGRTVIDSLPPARRSEKLENIEALFKGRR